MKISSKKKMLKDFVYFIFRLVIFVPFFICSGVADEMPSKNKKNQSLNKVAEQGSVTGRPIPRFVSLKSSKVNMRRGPGKEFRIDWIYYRKDLPVKIILEYLAWRKIEDFEGYTGWVHASLLSGKKSLIVIQDKVPLRNKPLNNASSIAYLQKNLLVALKICKKKWCQVEVDKYIGWVNKKLVWGDF